ncbi:MAG: SGNH/GDSL hydrolase family protein [Planctomycetes bacterium]|nr:SGNH/GDSL hydrolase family protein [Planctomycetota bacterium]
MSNPSIAGTSPRATARIVAALLGTGLAAAILFVGWRTWRARSSPDVEASRANADLAAALATRQLAPRGLELDPTARAEKKKLVREHLSEADVDSLLHLGPQFQYDPLCYYRFRAGLDLDYAMVDLPKGHWTRRTNTDGAREDHELARDRLDAFVLAVGDSHTEGICDNPESWPNRLEARLAAARPGKNVEVYNTGTSSYSFFHYWGVVERFLVLKPDAVIVCVYGGNDFVEVLRPYAFQEHLSLPPRPEGYYAKLLAALELGDAPLLQNLNQTLFFREHPEQRESALRAAVGALTGIGELLAERRIPWLAIYVPSAFDLPFEQWRETRAKTMAALALSEEDLDSTNRLADALLARTRAVGVEWLDLREVLPREGRWYWSEMHLGANGNALLAERLEPRMTEFLARAKGRAR